MVNNDKSKNEDFRLKKKIRPFTHYKKRVRHESDLVNKNQKGDKILVFKEKVEVAEI